MPSPLRNRIKRHVRLRAGDLVPHELNPRLHPETQKRTLEALYRQIGFARSLLAYELPDGRLKFIDGHLRAEITPDMEVEVEVLDVGDAEARALLLSIDPLAQLAGYDTQVPGRACGALDDDGCRPCWRTLWQNIASRPGRRRGPTLAEAS